MKTHFVLPVCFAAVLHGALLFGFPKHPRARVAIKEPKPDILVCPFIEIIDDTPIVTTEEPAESPKKSPVPPPPQSPEPLAVHVIDRPTMPSPKVPAITAQEFSRTLDSLGITDQDGTGPFTSGPLSIAHLDNQPRTRFQATPIYPFEAKRSGMHGEVHVEFTVDERGHVIDPHVVRSSDRIFDEPTLRAVAKWQFEPGRRHGVPVKFRMTVPVMFNVNERV
jgi:protein TonB